jgi:hypothetical protein
VPQESARAAVAALVDSEKAAKARWVGAALRGRHRGPVRVEGGVGVGGYLPNVPWAGCACVRLWAELIGFWFVLHIWGLVMVAGACAPSRVAPLSPRMWEVTPLSMPLVWTHPPGSVKRKKRKVGDGVEVAAAAAAAAAEAEAAAAAAAAAEAAAAAAAAAQAAAAAAQARGALVKFAPRRRVKGGVLHRCGLRPYLCFCGACLQRYYCAVLWGGVGRGRVGVELLCVCKCGSGNAHRGFGLFPVPPSQGRVQGCGGQA